MEKINKGIAVGSIVEFIEFDLEAGDDRDTEKRILSIGSHYIVEDVDWYADVPVYTITGKGGEFIPLYGYQLSVVKPVQKSTLHFSGIPFSFFKRGFHYETNKIVYDEDYVGGSVSTPDEDFPTDVLDCEIGGFTINNTGSYNG